MFKKNFRYNILLWLSAVVLLSQMDRVNLAIAAPFIFKEFGLSATAMGIVMGAFTMGYALTNFTAGYLIEHVSCRKLLAWIILMWSFMTAFTGMAWSFVSLLVIRIVFGTAEGPMAPLNAKMVNNWMLPEERGLASGIWLAFFPLGTVVGNMLSAAIAQQYGWRTIFYLFGSLGLIFSILSWIIVRDKPSEHSSVSPEELIKIQSAIEQHGGADYTTAAGQTFKQLMSNSVVWTLFYIFFAVLCILWANINWLPTYFVKTKGADIVKSSLFSSIPVFCAFLGPIFFGWISDRLGKGMRSLWLVLAQFAAVPAIIYAVHSPSLTVCLVGFSIASFLCFGCVGLIYTIPMELFKAADVGKVAGIVLTGGSLAGIIAPILVGFVLERTASFNTAYYVFSGIVFIGACCALYVLKRERFVHAELVKQRLLLARTV